MHQEDRESNSATGLLYGRWIMIMRLPRATHEDGESRTRMDHRSEVHVHYQGSSGSYTWATTGLTTMPIGRQPESCHRAMPAYRLIGP